MWGRASFPLLVLLAAGCGRSGTFAADNLNGGDFPLPQFPFPVASATSTPEPDNGDGFDGELIVTGTSVPNTCLPLGSASVTEATVEDTTAFTSGRRVLLLQVQDGTAISGESTPVTAAGNAGAWEIARVTSIGATSLTFEAPLDRAYGSDGTRTAQVCTVREFTDVTTTLAGDVIRGTPWDGASGGVVAFFVSGALELGADGGVSVTGMGFRGGLLGTSSTNENITVLDPNADEGAGKAEGLDITSRTRFGKGNYVNAAGGGNANEAGGGGGGNGGAGGFGGSQAEGVSRNTNCRGMGGAALAIPALPSGPRLFFGGGGGAGQHDDQNGDGPGGSGGGVILIFANELRGAGELRSNGTLGIGNGANGNGGGGAGGTILVWVSGDSSSFVGPLLLHGGAGGNDTDTGDECRGPGGGGAGGRAFLRGVTPLVIDSSGAVAGTCGGVEGNWDATPGSSGFAATW